MDETCKGLYIVLDGAFRVVDDDIVESVLTEGDSFGEASLIVPAKSQATLIAMEPSRVLLIDRKQFGKLIRRMPRLGNMLLRNLAKHLSKKIILTESERPIDLDDTESLG
jgi:CRP-like cAMP-binding protein